MQGYTGQEFAVKSKSHSVAFTHWLYLHTMKICFIVFIAFFLTSCADSGLKKQLMQSNEITIHFYIDHQPDSVIKIVHTTSREAINKLVSYIDSKEINGNDCGNDGDIVFMKGNKTLMTVTFNALQASCRQFTFRFNTKVTTTKVSDDAANFLMGLWAGKMNY